jgi:hypothetical protein
VDEEEQREEAARAAWQARFLPMDVYATARDLARFTARERGGDAYDYLEAVSAALARTYEEAKDRFVERNRFDK